MTPLIVLAASVLAGIPASDIQLRVAQSTQHVEGPGVEVQVAEDRHGHEPLPPWEVWVAAGSAYRPESGSGGFSGRIGVNRRFGRFLRGELELGSGAHVGDQQTVSLMRLGARIEAPWERVVPFLYLAFAHHHEMFFEDARRAPFSAALGLSEGGVIHRSGLDAGLGVALNLPRAPRSRYVPRVMLRASLCSMLGEGPAQSVDVILAVGSTF